MKNTFVYAIVVMVTLSLSLASCREEGVPKPRGYFRIDLPEHAYSKFESECNMEMDVPNYAKVELFKDRMSEDSCWFNVHLPRLKATVYCTYFAVDNDFDKLVKDAYGFAAKHEMKATALKRTIIDDRTNQLYGIIYDIEGDAASQVQFFLSDSTKHFFRGSLYFNSKTNPDSLAPVLAFVREDIDRMVRSVRWK